MLFCGRQLAGSAQTNRWHQVRPRHDSEWTYANVTYAWCPYLTTQSWHRSTSKKRSCHRSRSRHSWWLRCTKQIRITLVLVSTESKTNLRSKRWGGELSWAADHAVLPPTPKDRGVADHCDPPFRMKCSDITYSNATGTLLFENETMSSVMLFHNIGRNQPWRHERGTVPMTSALLWIGRDTSSLTANTSSLFPQVGVDLRSFWISKDRSARRDLLMEDISKAQGVTPYPSERCKQMN